MTQFVKLTLAAAALGLPLLLFGACASMTGSSKADKAEQKMTKKLDSEQDLIRETVTDSERADRLIAHLDDRDALIEQHNEVINAHSQRIAELNADHSATRESFDSAIAAYNEARGEAQQKFVGLMDAMKAEVTAEEWAVISKFQIKKLNPRGMAYEKTEGDS